MAVAASSDAASKLNQAQLREIREAFLVLDRDNDGAVNRDDVADVLMNLGRNKPGRVDGSFALLLPISD